MKILVLGGGGFIGSHFLEKALEQTDWNILAVDLSSKKVEHLLPNSRLTFIKESVYGPSLNDWIGESDIVVSLTAICNPSYYNTETLKVIEANFIHPLEIVKICASRRKRLIQFSTSEVYGKTPASLGVDSWQYDKMSEDESPLILGPVAKQRWSYSCAKQLLERAILACGKEQGLHYTIIRPFNFIGPRMDYIPGVDGEGVPRVLACFMAALILNQPLQLVNGGLQKRVFTSIGDGIEALMAVIKNPQASFGKVFNVGNPNNEISIADLARKMMSMFPEVSGRQLGRQCRLKIISGETFYGPGYDDSDRRLPDISLAQSLLNWKPGIDLNNALRHSMRAYLDQYSSGNLNVA
ncbi:bifunctional UDP-4-keto-pentose/UDP-xylose synthase [Fibrobacterota bacterium]